VKQFLRVVVLVISLAIFALMSSTPVMAHDRQEVLWTGAPPVMFVSARGGVRANHTVVFACDEHADNEGVRTLYLQRGVGSWQRVGDGNGAAEGCGERTVPEGILRFRLCEGDRCTGEFEA
jgi:hypothetical protein